MKSRDGESQRRKPEEKVRQEQRRRKTIKEEKARRKKIKEEKARRKKIREEKVRRKKMQVREKVGQTQNTAFFPMVCGSGGSKSRLPRAGAGPSGPDDGEKVACVVAPSTCPSQKHKKLTVSDNFFKAEMLKKGTPLWREARVQGKMHTAHHAQTTFAS